MIFQILRFSQVFVRKFQILICFSVNLSIKKTITYQENTYFTDLFSSRNITNYSLTLEIASGESLYFSIFKIKGSFMMNLPIILQLKQLKMNRQNWTFEEDSELKKLVQHLGVTDWTLIAQHLRINCSQCSRTGKQCRQRWYNHLIPTVNKKTWSQEEENLLFSAHRIHGNKWKQIAKKIHGRTDNDIKNHFYSTLRRSLRRLNKIIGQKNSTSQIREIKPSVLTTIMDFIYKHEYAHENELISSLRDLPILILQFASFKPKKANTGTKLTDEARDKIQVILQLVNNFNEEYCKDKRSAKNQENVRRKKSNRHNSSSSNMIVKQEAQDSLISQKQQLTSKKEADESSLVDKIKTEVQMFHYHTEQKKNFLISTEQFVSPMIKLQKNMFAQEMQPHDSIMNSIQQPSMFQSQNCIPCELEIVGKHWSPKHWEQILDEEQLDEILQMNYDNNI